MPDPRPPYEVHQHLFLDASPMTCDRPVTLSLATLRTWQDMPNPRDGFESVSLLDALLRLHQDISTAAEGSSNAYVIWAVEPAPNSPVRTPSAQTIRQYCAKLILTCSMHEVSLPGCYITPMCMVGTRFSMMSPPKWVWGWLFGILMAHHFKIDMAGVAPPIVHDRLISRKPERRT